MVAVIPPRAVRASSWITDYLVTGSPAPTDIAGLSNPLDDVLSVEFAAAQADLAATAGEVLLAAFGRAVARTIGDGRLERGCGRRRRRRDPDDRTGGTAVQGTAWPVGDDAAVGRPRSPARPSSRSRPPGHSRPTSGSATARRSPGLRRTPVTCWRCTPAATPAGPRSCTWTGGMTSAASTAARSRSWPGSSRWRSSSWPRTGWPAAGSRFALVSKIVSAASIRPSPGSLRKNGHRIRSRRPSRTERVGPSQPKLSGVPCARKRGGTAALAQTARRRPRAR